MTFWDRFIKWIEQPYSDDMDIVGWFLFAGLLAILTIAWGSIIRKVAQ